MIFSKTEKNVPNFPLWCIVLQVQLIGQDKDRIFIFHHVAKLQFCPFQPRFNSAASPYILPSFCQCTHELASFKLIILIKNFINYHLGRDLPQLLLLLLDLLLFYTFY